MNSKHKEIIREWMDRVVRDGSWRSYDDLHIDQVNRRLVDREYWGKGIEEILNLAVEIRDQTAEEFVIGIGLSLSDSKLKGAKSVMTWNDVLQQVNWTPPSLYVFDLKWDDWRNIERECILVDRFSLDIKSERKYLCEYYHHQDSEVRRSMFIVSMPTDGKRP